MLLTKKITTYKLSLEVLSRVFCNEIDSARVYFGVSANQHQLWRDFECKLCI